MLDYTLNSEPRLVLRVQSVSVSELMTDLSAMKIP